MTDEGWKKRGSMSLGLLRLFLYDRTNRSRAVRRLVMRPRRLHAEERKLEEKLEKGQQALLLTGREEQCRKRALAKSSFSRTHDFIWLQVLPETED